MRSSILFLFIGLAAFIHVSGQSGDNRPNIILIVADDLGYSDLGCYGGEVKTPALDKMAKEGVRFSNMHNASMCVVTRSSILTGKWWPRVGAGISRGSSNIAQELKKVNYRTGLVGKWHLRGEPNDKGFDYFFGFLGGFSNYFQGSKDYRLNKQPFTDFPNNYYSTDAFTDRAIEFVTDTSEDSKPFFLYLCYQSPHNPLQAPRGDIMKYRGAYLKGWQATRDARIKNQIKLGLIKPDTPLPAYPLNLPDWSSLTAAQKDMEDLRMSVYAAMVERMDKGIGRLMQALEASGKKDNTVVLFLSDNGTDSFSVADSAMVKKGLLPGDTNSNYQPGTGWAYATVTPWRLYKISQHAGGVTTGSIAWWPKGIKNPGSINKSSLHVVDIAPTILELAMPADIKGKQFESADSFAGQSFVPLLKGKSWKRKGPMYFQYMDNRGIRTDKWTLVEVDGSGWELYDIQNDPLEAIDLSKTHPEIVTELAEEWLRWWKAESNNSTYTPTSTATGLHYRPQGDRGTGKQYNPTAMPVELSTRYKK